MSPDRGGVPMFFPPKPFDLGLAVTCAKLVDTAYDMECQWQKQGKPGPSSFRWTPPQDDFTYSDPIWGESKIFLFLERNEPFAVVARRSGQVFLAIRGTETLGDDAEDLKIDQVDYAVPGVEGFGKVHKGFYQIYDSMREAVLATLGSPPDPPGQLVVTGHSLGSSLATLAFPDVLANSGYAVPDWNVVQINLASPRTGDPTFAAAYDALAAANDWGNALTYRIVNTEDLVPEIPPAVLGDVIYQHVGIPIDFSAQYGSIVQDHSSRHSYLYAVEHPDAPVNPNPFVPTCA